MVICADMLIIAMKMLLIMHENIHNYVIMKIIVKPSNPPPEKYSQARYRLLQGWG